MLRMRLLGRFDVSLDAAPVGRIGSKAQALLAFLASNRGRPVAREEAAGLLWGERSDDLARHSLNQALTSIRAALGPAAVQMLRSGAEAVQLVDDRLDLDVASFERAARGVVREPLERALQLYRGEFLAGLCVRAAHGFEDWMLSERYRLGELACDAFARLLDLQADADADAAIATARRLLTLTPLDETVHARLIQLYGRLGRRGLAEAHYARCAKLLREELGQDPGDEIGAALAEARRPPAKPRSVAPERESGWRPAIAVLPFANLAGDERWTRLADGIREGITTALACHGDLTVIAHSASCAFRDHHVGAREIGRELGVRYLLDGSIQAVGGRVRVTAQLIDAQSRTHVWAERCDRDEGDLFVIQDDIVQQVAGALLGWEGCINRAERGRLHRRATSCLTAYERYLLAYEAGWRLTRTDTLRAIELAESALALDPTLARGWLVRAYALDHAVLFGWAENPVAARRAYEQSIVQAHRLDPMDGAILIGVGDLQAKSGDLAGARAAYEEAARVAADHGDTLALLAKYVAGVLERPEEARAMMQRAFRLNPGAPPVYFYNQLRVAYVLSDFQAAIVAAGRSPDTALTKLFLALSLACVIAMQKSEEVVRLLSRDRPDFDPRRACELTRLLAAPAQVAVLEGVQSIKLMA